MEVGGVNRQEAVQMHDDRCVRRTAALRCVCCATTDG